MKSKLLSVMLIAICVIAIQTSANAQSDLKKGYIVTYKGDTIKGFVDVRAWGLAESYITFSEKESEGGKHFSPYDISAFGFDNEVYEGAYVDVEYSSRVVSNLSTNANLIKEKHLIFLQKISGGSKPLYISHITHNNLFYIKSDTAFVLLEYKKYLKDEKDSGGVTRSRIVENKTYIGQLALYLSDCPQITDEIHKTSYDLKSMISLFGKYQKCKLENIVSLTHEPNYKLTFGITAGVMMTTIDFRFIEINKHEPVNFTSVPIGISLEINKRVNLQQWSFYSELICHAQYDLMYETEYHDEISSKRYLYSYEYRSIKLSNMVKYIYAFESIKFFGGAGLAIEDFRGKWDYNSDQMILGTKVRGHDDGFNKMTILKPCLSLGAKYDHFNINFRYEMANKEKYMDATAGVLVSYTF